MRRRKMGAGGGWIRLHMTFKANGEHISVAVPIDSYCEIVEARETHKTAGSDGGGLTLTVEKLTGTQAVGGGANCFKTSTFNLRAAADTPQLLKASLLSALSVAQRAAQLFAPGDRLGFVITGVTTAVVGTAVHVLLRETRSEANANR